MIADRLRLLGLVLVLLTLVLVLEWVWPLADAGGAQLAGVHLARGGTKASLQARATEDWANSVLARPLFSLSRRPPKLEAHAGGAAAPGQMRLSGILIGRFGKRAIFAPDGGGKPLVLGEGASVNESFIRSIQATQVVLASGAVLSPSFDKNRAPPQPFVPPFQPAMGNFTPSPFANGQMPPGAAFPMQHSVMPQPPQIDDDNQDGAAPPTPPQVNQVPVPGVPTPLPVFRGPMIPQRRE